MSSLSSIRKLIAEFNEEDELWEKETEKHFENRLNAYSEMFTRIKNVKDQSEQCMVDITKDLNKLVDHQNTIENALKHTDNLDGLPLSPEKQENAIDLVNKITKFMNNTELITSPNPILPEEIQKEVASYTASVAQELKDYKTDLRKVKTLNDLTQLLNYLTTNSTDQIHTQKKLSTITENENE